MNSYFALMAHLRNTFTSTELAATAKVCDAVAEYDKQAGNNLVVGSFGKRIVRSEADLRAFQAELAKIQKQASK